MLVLSIIFLALLTLLNYKYSKSFLYPPTLFSFLWLIFLFLLLILGDMFYDVQTKALLVYTLGAFAFSIGGLFSLKTKLPLRTRLNVRQVGFIKFTGVITLLVLIAGFPFYWLNIQQTVSASGIDNFWVAIRVAELEGTRNISPLLTNLVPLSLISALMLFSLKNKSRFFKFVTFLTICLSGTYNLLTAGRAGLILLIMSLLGIHLIHAKKVKIKSFLLFGSLFMVAFSFAQIALNKGSATSGTSFVQNIPALVDGFFWYALGGIVAFGNIVNFPNSVPSTGGTFAVIKGISNSLGANFYLPESIHAVFTRVASDKITNVYTIYFHYYKDFGLIGTIFMMLLLGFVLSIIYKHAMTGNQVSIILYGFGFSGLVMSGFAEQFFWQFNFLLKLIIILFVVNFLPKFSLNKRHVKLTTE